MVLPGGNGEGTVIYDKSSIGCTQRTIEQAGHSYQEMCKRAYRQEQNGALCDEEEKKADQE